MTDTDDVLMRKAAVAGLSIDESEWGGFLVIAKGRKEPLFDLPTRLRARAFIAARLNLELDAEGDILPPPKHLYRRTQKL